MSQASFGEIRSIAHGTPSSRAWDRLCSLLQDLLDDDPDSLETLIAPYLQDTLDARWPTHLLSPPPAWSDHPSLLAITPHPGARYLLAQRRAWNPDTPPPPLLPNSIDPLAPALEASHILHEHPARICSLLPHPDGFLSIDTLGHLRFWSQDTQLQGSRDLDLEPHEEVHSARTSTLGPLILIHDTKANAWRAILLTPNLQTSWRSPTSDGSPHSVVLSPDREHLVACVDLHHREHVTLRVFARHPWTTLWERHFDHAHGAALHPNGTHVVITGQDQLEALEVVSGASTLALPNDSWALHADYSPRGSFLVTSFQGAVHLWDTFGEHQRAPATCCDWRHDVSADERYLTLGALLEPNHIHRHVIVDLTTRMTLGQIFTRMPGHAHLSPNVIACDPPVCVVGSGRTLRIYPIDPPGQTFDLSVPRNLELSDTLDALNDALFAAADAYDLEWLAESHPSAHQTRWLGQPGALEQDIQDAQARLGRRLPSSFASFLRHSNGWHNFSGFPVGICALLGTQDLFWARDRHVLEFERDQHDSYYDLGEDWFFPWPELPNMLVIGHGDGNEYLLLNPTHQRDDGEWEVWEWHKECGFASSPDFLSYIESFL